MSGVDLLKTKEIIKDSILKAVENEQKGNWKDAFDFYFFAIEKLKILMQADENKYNKNLYIEKAKEYYAKASEIKINHLGISVNNDTNNKSNSSNTSNQNVNVNVNNNEKSDKADLKDNKKDENNDEESKKIQEALSSCMVTEKPNVKWEDVAGLEKAKEALKEAVILPLKFKHLFNNKRKPWKGILLYGPPGTGKSYIAKACATEVQGTFFSVSASNIMSKYVGEAERTVRALFDLARQNKPAVIFLDEIDSLLSARGDGEQESTRRVKTEFLVQMQGVGKDDNGILVLGATNIPWDLDPAVRRRFQKKIYISLPEHEARYVMFKLNLGKTPHVLSEEDIEDLSERTEGFSGSDIATLTQEAIYEPLRKCQKASYFKKINGKYFVSNKNDPGAIEMKMIEIKDKENLEAPKVCKEDFLSALTKIRPTVSLKDLVKQEQFTEEFGQEG